MRWFIWGLILPASLTAFYMILRRIVHTSQAARNDEEARDLFRIQREWLEARFLTQLERTDPIEWLRWEDATWHDEAIWGRDRKTRRLLALVGVHFDPEPYDLPIALDSARGHATVVFEYRDGRWQVDGKWFNEVHPHEAFQYHQRFEPIVVPPPRRPGLV